MHRSESLTATGRHTGQHLMHVESYREMARLVDRYLDGGRPLRVLDVGSADVNGSYRPLFVRPGWVYQGLDMAPGPNVDIVVDHPYRWRLAPGSCDLVVSGQALEHMPFFWLSWRSMVRLVRPGGLLFLIVPSKGPEHRYPVDCWRFYPDAMQALAEHGGLELLEATTRWESPWGDTVGVFRKPARTRSILWKLRRLLARLGPAPASSATVDRTVPQASAPVPIAAGERRSGRLVAAYRAAYAASVADWTAHYLQQLRSGRIHWMGAPARGNPVDFWVYQELLAELRPQTVVKLGDAPAGNTLFLLQMLDLIGTGILVSVSDTPDRIDHPRLRRIEGNPASDAVRERVAALIGGGSALIIRSGAQRHAAVLADLRDYAPLVTPGSYLIVEDGLDELLDGLRGAPAGAEGTLAAIMDFLEQNPAFEADHGPERFLISGNPWGFLKRRALPEADLA